MNKQHIPYNDKMISFFDEGKGDPLVFLHGFMGSAETWSDYITTLSLSFRVIAIDLPGHGESEMAGEVHTMELMAEIVHHILKGAWHQHLLFNRSQHGRIHSARICFTIP